MAKNISTNDIFFYEELSINAWPALQTIIYDGWILRMAEAYANRANSISPIYPSKISLEEKIKHCEELYSAHNIPPAFKLCSYPEHKELEELLEKKGYSKINPTSLQTCKIADLYIRKRDEAPGKDSFNVVISSGFTAAWQDAAAKLTGTDEKHIPVFKKILANIKQEKIIAHVEITNPQGECEIIGCGCGIIERNNAGIYDIAVREDYRRKGLGRQIVECILLEAKKRGVENTYLQVMLNNEAALNLYKSMGYTEIYKYWYRKKV